VATALALLPLLGSGSTPVSGPYREPICKGVSFLIARQGADGSLWEESGGPAPAGGMYVHLIAHLALAEALLVAQDAQAGDCDTSTGGDCTIDFDDLRQAVERAAAFSISAMTPDGSWRYSANAGAGDMSFFSWGVGALMTSQKAGVNVSQATIDKLNAFLAGSNGSSPITDQGVTINSQYMYKQGEGGDYGQNNRRNTVYALLSHVFLGKPKNHSAVVAGAALFTNPLLTPGEPLTGAEPIHVYYANFKVTQLKYAIGGDQWADWNAAIRELYRSMQQPPGSGHRAGSIYGGDDTALDNKVGRLYTTALCTLCLESAFTGLRLTEP